MRAELQPGRQRNARQPQFRSPGVLLRHRLWARIRVVDADPSLVVSDFLTNAQYGVGFPQASIDATTLFGSGGDASYQTYCRAVGLALSPALTDQERASCILGRWLQLTNTAAVWSGGLLASSLTATVPSAATASRSIRTSRRSTISATTTSRSRTTRTRCRSRAPIPMRPITSGASKSPSAAMPTI